MKTTERTEHEARAQSTHDSYAEHIVKLLDMIDDRDDQIEKLEDTVSDLEQSVAELEEED